MGPLEPADAMNTTGGNESRGSSANRSPLFLFSLPRSGSTLAQRVLGAHENISTLAEPWILLPYLYTLRDRGIYAEYHHRAASAAIRDFCKALPNGQEDYLSEMREFALQLYIKASQSGARYFLDKTPRYHLVADDILSMFPNGKFLFLWRNPLAIVASIMETWSGGKWNLCGYRIDLFEGLENLIRVYETHRSKVHAMRYEDLLTDSAEAWSEVFRYLELPFDPSIVERFSNVELGGKKGDPSGTRKYLRVSREPLEKWRRSLNNPIRRAWCRRYLHWIGERRLAVMGYELEELLGELDAIPMSTRRLGSDALRIGYGQAREFFEPRIFKHKVSTIPNWRRIHTHR
jgi:hypothetical protein